MEKKCGRCKEVKDISEFYTGSISFCRVCKRESNKESYHRQKEKQTEKRCSRCRVVKPHSDFYSKGDYYCRDCKRELNKTKIVERMISKRCKCGKPAKIKGMCGSCYTRDWYSKNTEKAKSYQRKYQRQIRRINKKENYPIWQYSSLSYGVIHDNIQKMTPEQIVRYWPVIVINYKSMRG